MGKKSNSKTKDNLPTRNFTTPLTNFHGPLTNLQEERIEHASSELLEQKTHKNVNKNIPDKRSVKRRPNICTTERSIQNQREVSKKRLVPGPLKLRKYY